MTLARPIGRLCGVIAVLAAVLAVALHVSWAPAVTNPANLIGPTPATANASIVMTGPVTNLLPGDQIHFTVNTANGVTLNKVEAHVCAHGYTTYSSTTFGYAGAAGTRCAYGAQTTSGGLTGIETGYKLGPLAFSSVTTSGDQVFHAGIGTVDWVNSNGNPAKGLATPPGGTGPLTCDMTTSCDLVIDAGLTGDTTGGLLTDTWFIQPLSFADPSATTTTTTPTTTTTTTPGATTTIAQGATTTTAPGATTTTLPANAGATVTPSTVAPGGSITLASSGWKPSSSVNATLHSDPVTLGALTADATGKVSGAFTVPAGTATGAHTVVLDGQDAQSATRQVTLNVTVATSTGATGTGTGTSTAGALAFTGDATRDLASVALLILATGLFFLGEASRRRASGLS